MKRKGISPLIAAVLLIAFTLAVAAILTAWVTTFTKNTTGTVGNESQRLISCSYAGLSIYDAVWDQSGDVVTVSIANTGTKDLQNVSVVVFNDVGLTNSTTVDSIPTGSVETAQVDVGPNPDRVRAASTQCPQTIDETSDFTTVS